MSRPAPHLDGPVICHLTQQVNFLNILWSVVKTPWSTWGWRAAHQGNMGLKLFICQPSGLLRDVSGMLSFHPCGQCWTLKSWNGLCAHIDVMPTLTRETENDTGVWQNGFSTPGCRRNVAVFVAKVYCLKQVTIQLRLTWATLKKLFTINCSCSRVPPCMLIRNRRR